MQYKKIMVAWLFLGLLSLTACGPKVVENSDLVSIEYAYQFEDWTTIEKWDQTFTMWNTDYNRLKDIILWAKIDDTFTWTISWQEIFKSEYNPNNILSYGYTILTEVLWIPEPIIWTEVRVDSIWVWIITNIEKDSDGYDSYIVNFNDPKTYSDIQYYIKIKDIEKL